jgi:SAM-dependent methyltransferase
MLSILDQVGEDALREYLSLVAQHLTLDVDAAAAIALASIRHYRTGQTTERVLERRWYAALRAGGAPDYAVYNDPDYASDLWACWVVYSRKYLLQLRTIRDRFTDVASIADLGCGFGYTTAGLVELFPGVRVCGTNLEQTFQFATATAVGRQHGFDVVPKVSRPTDLVFASEYFEHFDRPVDHLFDVIATARPRYFVIANAFSATSIGHFDCYHYRQATVPNAAMGRLFNAGLRHHGYGSVETGFWNNRPAVWKFGHAPRRNDQKRVFVGKAGGTGRRASPA